MNQSQRIAHALHEDFIDAGLVQPDPEMASEVRIAKNPDLSDWQIISAVAIREKMGVRWLMDFDTVTMQHDLYLWTGPVAHETVAERLGFKFPTYGSVKSEPQSSDPQTGAIYPEGVLNNDRSAYVLMHRGSWKETLPVVKQRLGQLFTVLNP